MAYKWKPSKSAKRQFAANMQKPEFAQAYYDRREARAEKRRAGSNFDYRTAGGCYTPTRDQHNAAFKFITEHDLTQEQKNACEMVMSAYGLNEKVHHDHIHVVNELRRQYSV